MYFYQKLFIQFSLKLKIEECSEFSVNTTRGLGMFWCVWCAMCCLYVCVRDYGLRASRWRCLMFDVWTVSDSNRYFLRKIHSYFCCIYKNRNAVKNPYFSVEWLNREGDREEKMNRRIGVTPHTQRLCERSYASMRQIINQYCIGFYSIWCQPLPDPTRPYQTSNVLNIERPSALQCNPKRHWQALATLHMSVTSAHNCDHHYFEREAKP